MLLKISDLKSYLREKRHQQSILHFMKGKCASDCTSNGALMRMWFLQLGNKNSSKKWKDDRMKVELNLWVKIELQENLEIEFTDPKKESNSLKSKLKF